MGIEKSVKPTFSSEKVGSFEPTTTFKTFLRPVIDLKVGSGHEVAKTVQRTVFSEMICFYEKGESGILF